MNTYIVELDINDGEYGSDITITTEDNVYVFGNTIQIGKTPVNFQPEKYCSMIKIIKCSKERK